LECLSRRCHGERWGLLLLSLLLLPLLLLLLLLMLLLLLLLLPERAPSSAAKAPPKPIRSSRSATTISPTFVVPTERTTAAPPMVMFPICLAAPFPFTLSRKALLARRRHTMSRPTGAPETISKVLDLKSIGAGTRQ
jgi:hypothetical protein